MQVLKDIKIKVIIMHNQIIIIKVIKKIQNNITINSITKTMFNTIITSNIKIKINISSQTNNINKNKIITISINKMLLQNKINKQA